MCVNVVLQSNTQSSKYPLQCLLQRVIFWWNDYWLHHCFVEHITYCVVFFHQDGVLLLFVHLQDSMCVVYLFEVPFIWIS